ncbi:ABC transporter ATP-binding protein [candidate division TA06 bacterium]|uniref:ABC transporter ATP-binding protein n=1 Tax=candidate division TA06 bacterium TaxID=2250710 RepID=A0A933ID08_UNCT6|nr:ABC transporter ATP-binding protein [candidate division TA06 bacterium]
MQSYIESNSPKDTGSLRLIFGWLHRYWTSHRLKLLILLAMTMVHTALAISYPVFFKLVVDGLVSQLPLQQLTRNVLFLLLLGVGAAIVNWMLMSTRGWTNMNIEAELRNKIFANLTRLGPSTLSGYRTGDVVTRLTDDLAEKLSWFTCSGLFRAAQGLALFAFIMIVMFRLNATLAGFALLPVPIVAWLFLYNEKTFEKRFLKLQNAISAVNDFLEACFSGIRVLKVYNRQDHQKQGFSRAMDRRIKAEVKTIQSEGLFNSSNILIDQMGVLVVLLAGGWLVIKGRLTLGSFVAFNTYSLMMIEPLWNMGNFFITGKRAAVSYARVRELETALPEVGNPLSPAAICFTKDIEFNDVSFSYGKNDKYQLKDISFNVAKGEKIALMGEVGCGKTTLAHMLLRLHDPASGAIKIDGTDIRDFKLSELRSIIGYAPQEALLFSDSILNNVIFHRKEVDQNKVVEAGRISQLEKEVKGFAQGYDTLIGQRGASLSGGQKQRTSLARAIVERIALGHPQILILDDITSALDATTEALVWQELNQKLPGVTCFIISHRTSTIERADKILVLKDGMIVEQGSHQELMAKDGYYVTLREKEMLQENGNGQNGRNQEDGRMGR